jgi:hypothetical protein
MYQRQRFKVSNLFFLQIGEMRPTLIYQIGPRKLSWNRCWTCQDKNFPDDRILYWTLASECFAPKNLFFTCFGMFPAKKTLF